MGIFLAYGRRKQKFMVNIMAYAVAMSTMASALVSLMYPIGRETIIKFREGMVTDGFLF